MGGGSCGLAMRVGFGERTSVCVRRTPGSGGDCGKAAGLGGLLGFLPSSSPVVVELEVGKFSLLAAVRGGGGGVSRRGSWTFDFLKVPSLF